MQAHVGDAIAVHSRHVGEHERVGVIAEVRGPDGAPPYLVKWDDGKQAVFFPSADCTLAPKSSGARR
jgi:Domain of unknown function (DUF1918)